MIIHKPGAIEEKESQREVFTKDSRDTLEKEYKWRKRALDGEESKAMDGGGTFKM